MNTSAKRAVAACALLAGTALSTSALAQTAFPPTKNNIAGMGVDLKRGSFTYSHDDISTGNGPAVRAPSLTRVHNSEFNTYQGAFGPGTTHNYDIKLYETTEAGQAVVVLLEGFSARKFTRVGLTYVPQARDGTTLERLPLSGSTYYYRYASRDGTRTSLVPSLPCTTSFGLCYVASVIVSPKDGTTFLSYDGGTGVVRLRSVISSIGRALYFGYAGSSSTVATVTAVNLAQTYCTAFCTPPAGLPQVTYAYTGGRLTSFANTLGKTTSYSHDANGRLLTVQPPTSPSGPLLSTGYDASGRVSSQSWNGKAWNYNFTLATGEITQATMTDPLGGVTTTRFGNLPAPDLVTDAEGNTTIFGYDQYNRLNSTTPPGRGATSLLHDDRGNVTKVTTKPGPQAGSPPPDRVVEYTFDAACGNQLTCNQPTAITNTRGTTELAYDPASGHLTRVTSPPATVGAAQAETRYAYTPRQPYVKASNGSPSTQVSAGSNTLLLGPIPLLTSISRCSTSAPSTCSGASDKIVSTFDHGPTSGLTNLDLVSAAEDATGMGLTSRFSYDPVGNLTAADGPRAGSDDTTRTEYDRERRVTKITEADSDGLGPLAAPVTVFGYDDDGRLVRTARQNGGAWVVSCTRFSAAGLTARQWGPAETSSPELCPAESDPVPVVDYAYDDVGRVMSSTQRLPADQGGDRVSEVDYYADGRVKTERLGVGSADEQDYRTITYTPDGLTETVKDARGNLTTYEYSGFGELAKIRYPDKANGAVSSGTDAESFSYDVNGNLDMLTQRDGTPIKFSYDALDRVVKKVVPEADRDVSYTYDLLGRPTAANLPGANAPLSVTWSYDKLGRALSETVLGRTTAHAYDPAGAWEQVAWPNGGPTVRRDYDVLGRMSAIKHVGGGDILGYGYDQLSRRKSVANANGASTSYGYDALGRLQSLGHNLAGADRDVTFSLGYNRAGQITSRGFADAYAWDNALNLDRAYKANPLDQYTDAGMARLEYDGRGNLARDARQSYVHDSENQLVSVTGSTNTSLAYDAIGRLARMTSGGQVTEFGYDGDQLVAEYDGAGAVLRRYVHGTGIDEPVLWWEGSGTGDPRRLHADERGSIVAGSNASGAPLFVNSYGPFGEPGKVHTGRFGYTGQMRIPEFGLYYYKARYYSPALGRFIGTDPIGTADDQNLYSYVGNDPVNFVDPTGTQAGASPPPTDWITVTGIRDTVSDAVRSAADQARVWATTPIIGEDPRSLIVVTAKRKKLFKDITGVNYDCGPATLAKCSISDFFTTGLWLLDARALQFSVQQTRAVQKVATGRRVGSALKKDAYHRGASFLSRAQLSRGRLTNIVGGDGVKRSLFQVRGGINGKEGVFEYIVEPSGRVSHQIFKPGAIVNGIPN